MRAIKKYYSLEKSDNNAELYIYGDITSWPWEDSDVSSYILSKQLSELNKDDSITVYINSYGGEVAEGLAIYNMLKRFNSVTTVVDGFAASIASVIFMAGSKRIMNPASLLLIHNAWSHVSGNASDMRKEANDLDTITASSITAYMERVNIGEDKLHELMDAETWITPEDAVNMGFATEAGKAAVNQSARGVIMQRVSGKTPAPIIETQLNNFLGRIGRKGNT